MIRFLSHLDDVDQWAVDKESTLKNEKLSFFLRKLKNLIEEDSEVLDAFLIDFLEVLKYLTTSRCIYLLKIVSKINPDFKLKLQKIINEKNNSPTIELIRQRLVLFKKGEIFTKIYSKKNFKKIDEIMKGYKL